MPPPPVDASESAAIETLEKLGAKIDRYDNGHARLVDLADSKVTNDDLKQLGDLPHLESVEDHGR